MISLLLNLFLRISNSILNDNRELIRYSIINNHHYKSGKEIILKECNFYIHQLFHYDYKSTFLDEFSDEDLHFIIEKIFGREKKMFYDIIESIKPKYKNDVGFFNEFIPKDKYMNYEDFKVYLKEIYGHIEINELIKYYEKNKPTYIETIHYNNFYPGYKVNNYFYLFNFSYEIYDFKTLNREILIKALYKYALLKSCKSDVILISKYLKDIVFNSLKSVFNSLNTRTISNSYGSSIYFIKNTCSLNNSIENFKNKIENLCDNFSNLNIEYNDIVENIKSLFIKYFEKKYSYLSDILKNEIVEKYRDERELIRENIEYFKENDYEKITSFFNDKRYINVFSIINNRDEENDILLELLDDNEMKKEINNMVINNTNNINCFIKSIWKELYIVLYDGTFRYMKNDVTKVELSQTFKKLCQIISTVNYYETVIG